MVEEIEKLKKALKLIYEVDKKLDFENLLDYAPDYINMTIEDIKSKEGIE